MTRCMYILVHVHRWVNMSSSKHGFMSRFTASMYVLLAVSLTLCKQLNHHRPDRQLSLFWSLLNQLIASYFASYGTSLARKATFCGSGPLVHGELCVPEELKSRAPCKWGPIFPHNWWKMRGYLMHVSHYPIACVWQARRLRTLLQEKF